MWILIHGLFLITLLLTVTIFIVYPFSIKIFSSRRTLRRCQRTPSLTVIIPAYNEEAYIEKKVENILGNDYPVDRLRILVVDNGSTDKTLEIVKTLPVEIFQAPRGKISALNKGLQEAETECIVVTDADVSLEQGALRSAVSLIGEEIGAVSGVPKRRDVRSKREHNQQKHIQKEFKLRHEESLLHSACSLDGKLMVFLAELVPQFPPETVADDYELTFLTIVKGKRAVVDLEAGVFEERSCSFVQEVQRIRRWFKQGFLTSWRYRNVLGRPGYGTFGCWTFPFRRFFIYYIPFYFLFLFFYGWMFMNAWILIPAFGLVAFLVFSKEDYPFALLIGITLSWYDLLLWGRKKRAYSMGRWEH